MWLDLQKPVLLTKTAHFFATNLKAHQYTTKFHCQNKVVLGGLLLLAAFAHPTDDPYKWSGSLMELWWEGRGLSVTVKLHGIEWRLLLSLHYHFSWLSALCGPYQDLFHLFTFIRHLTAATLPLLSLPHTTILGSTLLKKLCKLAGKLFFLATWLGDSCIGKEMLYIEWKIGTRSFSHWRATPLLNN